MQTSHAACCSAHKQILSGSALFHMRLHHDRHYSLSNMHKLIKHTLLSPNHGWKGTDCILLHWSMQDGSPHSKQARHRYPMHHSSAALAGTGACEHHSHGCCCCCIVSLLASAFCVPPGCAAAADCKGGSCARGAPYHSSPPPLPAGGHAGTPEWSESTGELGAPAALHQICVKSPALAHVTERLASLQQHVVLALSSQ